MQKFAATLTIAAVAALVAAPASAVVTTFASFNAASAGNIVWVNNGTSGGTSTTYRSSGTGGTLFTTNSSQSVQPRNSVAGGVAVTFSFLNALSSYVNNLPAIFTLSATAVASPVTTLSGFKFQQNINTTTNFSFISSAPVTIQGVTYAAGSNLLTGSFTQGTIAGASGATSGGFSSSTTGGGSISYTSDFLNFGNTNDRDISLSLTSIVSLNNSINRGLNNVTGRALRSFRATATGSFSSDPAPIITVLAGVPEPQSWAMFLVGFGMIGFAHRRRNRTANAAA